MFGYKIKMINAFEEGSWPKPDMSGRGAPLWQTAVMPCILSVIVQACFSQVLHSCGPAQQKGEGRRGVPW